MQFVVSARGWEIGVFQGRLERQADPEQELARVQWVVGTLETEIGYVMEPVLKRELRAIFSLITNAASGLIVSIDLGTHARDVRFSIDRATTHEAVW